MNEFEQKLFITGAEGELRTSGIITEAMSREAADDIITTATADFVRLSDLQNEKYDSPVDMIMAFRGYLSTGKFALATFKAPVTSVQMSVHYKASDSATLTFSATAIVPDDTPISELYVSLYDQIGEAYKSFRNKRRLATSQQSNGNNHQTASNPTSEILDITSLRVEEKNGKRYLRAVGGRWTKFGVAAWPEIFDQLPVRIENLANGDNPVRIKAEIELGADGKPVRVTRFFN